MLFLVLWLVLVQAQPAQNDPALDRALRAHQAGDIDTAVTGYREFLKKHPNNYEIRSNLGAALVRQGKLTEAIVEYKAALQRAPSNPGIALNLALAYYKAGEIDTAARELSTLHALVPDNQQVILLLADCWLQTGQDAKVISLLTPRAAKSADDLSVDYLLGTALLREKRVDEGQKVLERIFARGESAETHMLMGTAKLSTADFAGALADLTKAVELNPKLPSVNSYWGQALMATGDSLGAAKAFRAELEQNPYDFNANINLAVILKQDQEYAQAMEHLNRALRVRPGNLSVRYQIGTIHLAEGRIEPARAEFEACVKEAPKFTEAHVSLATVYYRLKRKQDGDRERAIVQQLNAEAQEKQPKGEAMAPSKAP